jgi:hypothetical protein
MSLEIGSKDTPNVGIEEEKIPKISNGSRNTYW